ncbi:MAG TPA: phospholipid scramblase-related protein [Actinomycetes bacterium]
MPRTPSDPYEQYPDQRYGYQQHPDQQPTYQEHPDQRYPDQGYAQQQYPDQRYAQQQYPDQRYAQQQYGQQQHYSHRYQQAPAVAGRLMDHSSFIVDQKVKLIELRNEYSIYDDGGNTIGSVKQIGQSALIRVLRLFIKTDSLLGITLEIREASGAVALLLRKPAFRITCTISSPDGTAIGRIAAKIRVGKVRMAITDPSGNVLGEIRAENLRAWNFNVQDAQGRLIARVDKKWAGARELFTTADKYRVELDPKLGDPLRSLVVASCLAIDTLLKQQQ